jgi:hypothetical protein
MRAYIGEVDHTGLRRFIPEEVIPMDELGHLARRRPPHPGTVVWALLDEGDAEVLRLEVYAGHHHQACGLLLNRAVELLPLVSASPDLAGRVTP